MRVATGAALLLLGIGSVVGDAGAPAPIAAQERRSQRPASARVPLVAGLIAVSALHEPGKADYESILKVDDVSAGLACYTLSADLLDDLKTRGQTSLAASIADDDLGHVLGAAGGSARAEASLERVEPQPVPISVIVNDSRVDLPAVHARGTLASQPFDIYMLDDAVMPIVLQWRLGDTFKRMIRISYPLEHTSSRIADRLVATGRAEVYGIYFDFSTATIRPESEPVLKEIAELMARNPAWKLSVEGHTDDIGGAASNQYLSTRRAATVRQALIDRYHVAGSRLAPTGFGASCPKETNDTLEGRARNRRVELVRHGDGQWG
jgi:flagellar motor protein MotB